MKDHGRTKYILGIVITYLPSRGIFVSQCTYLEAALTKFGTHECHPLPTLMDPGLQLVKFTKPCNLT